MTMKKQIPLYALLLAIIILLFMGLTEDVDMNEVPDGETPEVVEIAPTTVIEDILGEVAE